MSGFFEKLKQIPLFVYIFIGLVLGVIYGVALPGYVKYVSWMGTLFMRLLKMIIVPLVLTSIVSGVANVGGADNLGRLGLKTITYYVLSSLAAITTGLFFVNIFKPGVGLDLNLKEKITELPVSKPISQTLIEIVPENIFKAFTEGNMLSIIFFAILFGFFITRISGKYSQQLKDFFNASFEAMMKLTQFIIKFTPAGVFGIIAKVVAESGNLGALAAGLGKYFVVVLAGLFFHAFVTLPLAVRFLGKVNPFKFMWAMSPALLTAFSTSSSGATLSLTMENIKNKVGVSNKIASFTLPLGATINMDGTALYELVAAMFIAQVYGIHLTLGQQIIAVFTALLASIGAAAIPMAGLVMLTIVMTTLGLPLEGVGLILAVDRFLDMFRTSVNVWSDSTAALIIARSEGEKFLIDENQKNES